MAALVEKKVPLQEENRAVSTVDLHRMEDAGMVCAEDVVAVEEPLEIQLGYRAKGGRLRKSIAVTMRTPGNDDELAAGFLFTEGVVREAGDIVSIREASPERMVEEPAAPISSARHNSVHVELGDDVQVNLSTLERNFYTTSSCGICGKASLLALRSVCPPRRKNELHFPAGLVYGLPEKLREAQHVFAATGGLHGAGLFSPTGELLHLREDIGRHNAVDKLIGARFLADEVPLRENILLLSGRASFELLQKAVMAGIPAVVAVGAPSSLAIQVAREFDVTLIAFLREHRFNIYHGADRVELSPQGRGLSNVL